jgi:hypothetical protein
MTFTALQVDKQNNCWMVRRWQVPETRLDLSIGKIFDDGWRSIRNSDYTEALVWGAASEQEAIEMAKQREGWA